MERIVLNTLAVVLLVVSIAMPILGIVEAVGKTSSVIWTLIAYGASIVCALIATILQPPRRRYEDDT